MLVLAPLHASPGSAVEAAVHDGASMAMMAGHGAHDMPASMHDCCQAPSGHDMATDCHCATTCASVLPVLAMPELAGVARQVPTIPGHVAMAPGIVQSPPLRPPMPLISRQA